MNASIVEYTGERRVHVDLGKIDREMDLNVELRPTYEECVAQLTGVPAAAENPQTQKEEALMHKKEAHAPVFSETGQPMQKPTEVTPAHKQQQKEAPKTNPPTRKDGNPDPSTETDKPMHEQEVPPAHPTQKEVCAPEQKEEETAEPVAETNPASSTKKEASSSWKKKRMSAAPPPMRTSSRIRTEPKRLKF